MGDVERDLRCQLAEAQKTIDQRSKRVSQLEGAVSQLEGAERAAVTRLQDFMNDAGKEKAALQETLHATQAKLQALEAELNMRDVESKARNAQSLARATTAERQVEVLELRLEQ